MGFTSWLNVKQQVRDGAVSADYFSHEGSSLGSSIRWFSYWTLFSAPGNGVQPPTTPGVIYTNAVGSLRYPDTSGVHKFLLALNAACNDNTSVLFYDRLAAVSIDATAVGDKIVNSIALPRYASGAGVIAFLELTTATSVTSVTLSMSSYTNEAGVAGRFGPSAPAIASPQNRDVYFLPVQEGDQGIRSVETINVSAATATALVVNVVLAKVLFGAVIPTNIAVDKNLLAELPAFARIYDGASIGVLGYRMSDANISGNNRIRGELQVVRR